MSKRVLQQRDYLSVLSRCSPQLRKTILSQATPELIQCIGECILNVSNGNVPHKKHKQVKAVAGKVLHTLRNKTTSLNKKRKVLIQNGGFLPAILIPALTSI